MLEVLKSLQARVMIPMHFFGGGTLNRFPGPLAGHLADRATGAAGDHGDEGGPPDPTDDDRLARN